MTNQECIDRFESDVIGDDFHHADHVRLGFAYLCEFPTLTALGRFSSALKCFAAARGKPKLYNETITCAYFFLIRARMAARETQTWEDFAPSNPDLLTWKDGILSRYYSEATLTSDLARRVFVLPDKALQCP